MGRYHERYSVAYHLPTPFGRFHEAATQDQAPVVLTVQGRAAAIVQDAAAYQRLRDIATRADAREGIRQGL
jgi:PHD/YefM family antitoxin component YafN of YafNO toxin-antitoxin module